MVVKVHAVLVGREHAIAWLNLQADGSISVGLADRAFISRRFHARQDLWNADNRVTVQYLVPNSPNDLRAVTNPHLTFHPPIYFHLRANQDEELFAGIAEVELVLADDAHMPWVRFVSRPIREIPETHGPRDPAGTTVLRVPLASIDCSVGLAVDFVRPDASVPSGRAVDHFSDCGGNRIHVSCEVLVAQEATLSWYHQY